MNIFRKKNIFLGIDFGSRMIKVVEITFKNQRPYLTNYAYTDIPNGGDAGSALAATIKKMKPASRSAYAALPGSSGLVTVITFPHMSDSDLAKAVTFEARKHIPIPLKDVNVSWDVIARSQSEQTAQLKMEQKKNNDITLQSTKSAKKGGKGELLKSRVYASKDHSDIHVLLVAAPRKDVSKYEGYIKQASLSLAALELETFSLVRSLTGGDDGQFLIVDIGAKATNIILVKNGVIHANRNIGVGGESITQALMQSLGVDFDRADAYKKERGDILDDASAARPIVDTIVEESRRVLAADGKDSMIDSVILSGGGSMLIGIDQYLSKALNVKVVMSTPWARIIIDPVIAPYTKEFKGSFSVAAGLALRGAEEYQIH